jgi:hypothetical protein
LARELRMSGASQHSGRFWLFTGVVREKLKTEC